MDKGTKAYTEFDWSEDVVKYRMTHEDADDWCVGHIHSHNSMSVFFSGTDESELNDNAPKHNIYLSLIVNNFMEMKARLALIGSPKNEFIFRNEKGLPYNLIIETKTTPIMFWYECEILGNSETVTVSEEFAKRTEEIDKKVKEVPKLPETKTQLHGNYTPSEQKAYNQGYRGNSNGYWDAKSSKDYQDNYYGKEYEEEKHVHPNSLKKPIVYQGEDLIQEISPVDTPNSKFFAFLVRLGSDIVEDNVGDAINDIVMSDINIDSLVEMLTLNYTHFYESYYFGNKSHTTEDMYIKVLKEGIEIFEAYEASSGAEECDLAKGIGNALKMILKEFDKSTEKVKQHGNTHKRRDKSKAQQV